MTIPKHTQPDIEHSLEAPYFPLSHLTIVYSSDMNKVSPGGIQSCLWEFIRSERANVRLLGIEGPIPFSDYLPPNVTGLPLMTEVGDGLGPLNMRFMVAIFKWLFRPRPILKGSTIWFHRCEHILPFAILRPLSKNRIILTIHSPSEFLSRHFRSKIMVSLSLLFERIAIWRSDMVVLVSERQRPFYLRMYPWAADKFTFVPNPVNTKSFSTTHSRDIMRQSLGIPVDAPVFIYHGRMAPEKRIDLLIEAFAKIKTRLPNARLLLVGGGVEQERLEANAHPDVCWTGYVPRLEIPNFVGAADVALLASEFEGMPLCVLESLALGLPVVSTDVGDVPLLIREGESGAIVKMPTADSIADAAIRVFADRDVFKSRCRAIAADFSTEAFYERMKAILSTGTQ